MRHPTPYDIRNTRKTAGLTQTQAASCVHYSRAQWQKWEKGDHIMPLTAWELFVIKVRAGSYP